MTTVACVLRSGGVYTPEWVWALRRGLARHAVDFDFRVLSDTDCFGRWGERLQYRWPGWWAKLELFRPGLFTGPVLYLDLDTLVVGDLAEILSYDGPLAMISDFYRPQWAQSGVMAWTPGEETDELWHAFVTDPDLIMRTYPGDGQYLNAYTVARPGAPAPRLQDLFPDQIVSYKVHARAAPPPDARLVCFHGHPKPHEEHSGWAHAQWRSLR